uniref:hypothetical protein n=1 Tax=Aliarcobacter sp. TaxID=2321116 RepID=UPI004048575F
MTKEQFKEKYNCNSSLIYHYFRKFKCKNIQQIDNIIQERHKIRLQTQNIMIDKTGNHIKEFFNNTTRPYQFLIYLYQSMDGEILVKDPTVNNCIKIINKYEDKMRKIHIAENIILDEKLADDILKIAHKKNIIKSDDVLNGCDYFTYYPNTKIVSFHIKDPLFWEDLSLNDFLVCYEEIISKKAA